MEEIKQIKSFRDLEVWQLAHSFVLEVYKITEKFPKNEEYRITSQLLRAVVSIPTNIAEGKGRQTLKDYIHFLIIARGSLEETKYLLFLSKELSFIGEEKYFELEETLNTIGKKLNNLINSLKS